MSVLLTTHSDAPLERMDHWRDIVRNTFVPLESEPVDERPFDGQIRSEQLGALSVSDVSADGHIVRRTPRLISASDGEYYKCGLQMRGYCVLTQDGREAVLAPRDFAVYDATRPYQLAFDDSFRMLVLMFPRNLLRLPVEAMATVTATRVSGRDGLGGLVSTFVQSLVHQLDALPTTTVGQLADNVVDLLTTLFVECTGTEALEGDQLQRATLLRVKAFIEKNLDDPDLSPESIARAHAISTRYLHKIFQTQATSVARYVRQRRLEQCHRDLGDPRLQDRPVSAVAARWGLLDAAHFSKLFKSTYGESPREYRLSVSHSGQSQVQVVPLPE
jgi:AraC-like DNA-binding protein